MISGVLSFFPDRPVDFFIKWRAAGGELPLGVVLGAHQGSAVAERAADPFTVELAMIHKLFGKIGLCERASAHADEADFALLHLAGPDVEEMFLQPTVTAADAGQLRLAQLYLCSQTEMAMHPYEWVFGSLVAIERWVFKGPQVVGRGIGVAHGEVDHADAEFFHFSDPAQRFGEVGLIGLLRMGTPVVLQGEYTSIRPAQVVIVFVKGDAIIDVEPAGDQEAGYFVSDALDDVAGQPGAVLIAATIEAGAGAGGEEFVEQIAMALLDIDELKASLKSDMGSGDECIFEPLKIVVTE